MTFVRPAFLFALAIVGSFNPMQRSEAAGRITTTFSVSVQVAAPCQFGLCADGFTVRSRSSANSDSRAADTHAAAIWSDPDVHVQLLPPAGGMAPGYRIVSPANRAIDLIF